jgi:hypothetical protein
VASMRLYITPSTMSLLLTSAIICGAPCCSTCHSLESCSLHLSLEPTLSLQDKASLCARAHLPTVCLPQLISTAGPWDPNLRRLTMSVYGTRNWGYYDTSSEKAKFGVFWLPSGASFYSAWCWIALIYDIYFNEVCIVVGSVPFPFALAQCPVPVQTTTDIQGLANLWAGTYSVIKRG